MCSTNTGSGIQSDVIGCGVGLAGAVILGKSLQTFLFGIASLDPATYGLITVVLFVVAAAACSLPAKRAVMLDPAKAMRED